VDGYYVTKEENTERRKGTRREQGEKKRGIESNLSFFLSVDPTYFLQCLLMTIEVTKVARNVPSHLCDSISCVVCQYQLCCLSVSVVLSVSISCAV